MAKPITKLSDDFADFELRITCRKCAHVRLTEPHALARLVGWETPLTIVATRLRCSKCHARGECELDGLETHEAQGISF
jgi:hypothetical protein